MAILMLGHRVIGAPGVEIRSFVPVVSASALLLDTYTGAAAAYSLRKLRTAYAGSAIRVRRSSDNAEADIGFDGNDLDTDALSTHVGAGSGYVTKWYDQSGNTRDLAQSTAGAQPRIVGTGTVDTVNSLPAVKFQDNDDTMIYNSALTGLSSVDSFLVGFFPTADTIGGFIADSASGDQALWRYRDGDASGVFVAAGTPSPYVNGSAYSGKTQNNFYDDYKNIQFLGTALNCDLSAWTNLQMSDIGSGFRINNGFIQEFVAFSTDHSSDRAAIESNINTYWSIY